MFTTIKNLLRDESGVTAIEYGLIAALVAVAAVGAIGTLGGTLDNAFSAVVDGITGETDISEG